MEAKAAVTLLPVTYQDPVRYQVARNLEMLIRQKRGQPHNTPHTYREKQVLNGIQGKFKINNAMITKADNGNSIVTRYEAYYNAKVEMFLATNSSQVEPQEQTKRFQAEFR
jgi:uncharacterized protein YehS (DUF1456 family)